jgi:hypothetical protein
MMPMGCSESCSYFERFSTFIEWVVRNETISDNIDHYLDDFLFAGEGNTDVCNRLMNIFSLVCDRLNVPIANKKTVGPTTVLEYLGLTIDTVNMLVKIPDDKILELKVKISFVLKSKKVTLKVVSRVTYILYSTLPSGRVLSRRIYNAMSNVKKSYHLIRVSKNLKADLLVWSQFLEKFNGISYIQDRNWTSNSTTELYTDSAGGRKRLWCILCWEMDIFTMAYLLLSYGNVTRYNIFRTCTDYIVNLLVGISIYKQKGIISYR